MKEPLRTAAQGAEQREINSVARFAVFGYYYYYYYYYYYGKSGLGS